MDNFEVKSKPSQYAAEQTVAGTNNGTKNAPKSIFVGMTEAEAMANGLFDEYTKANTDGIDGISKEEYETYLNNENNSADLEGKSGKRTAPGGVYTIQKGDTLSKIAQDFGVDVYELYENNKAIIGNKIDLIQIGQKIYIKGKPEIETRDSSKQSESAGARTQVILKLPENVKSALGKLFGTDISALSDEEITKKAANIKIGELAQAFQVVMKNSSNEELAALAGGLSNNESMETTILAAAKNIDSPQKLSEFLGELSTILGENIEEISLSELPKHISNLDKTKKGELLKCTIKNLGDSQAIHPELQNIGSDNPNDVLEKIYGIDLNELKKIENKDERARVLAEAMYKKCTADMDLNNKDSYIQKCIAEIKAGKLTDYEKKVYGDSISNLSDEEIVNIAKRRIQHAHENIVVNSVIEDYIDGDYKSLMNKLHAQVICNKKAGMSDSSGKLAVAAANIAGMEDTPSEYRTEMSNLIASESKTLGVDNLNDDYFTVVTQSVDKYADKKYVEQFIHDNAERAELIRNIAASLLNNTTDPERRDILQGVINTATQYIADAKSSGGSVQGSQKADDAAMSYTERLRSESENYYANKGISIPTSQEELETQTAHQSANRIGTQLSIPEPIRYNPDRLQKLTQDFNNTLGHFDDLSPKEQEKVKQYLTAAQPRTLVSIMVTGNEKVQKFLLDYVSVEAIANIVKPDEIKNLIDEIKEKLAEHIDENIKAGILKENQMTQAQTKMYELNRKYN